MLPAAHRLTDGEGFDLAVRSGRRSGSRTLVVHWWAGSAADSPVRAGFVVSRAVGGAVVRNRVKRRLRHLTREHLAGLSARPGTGVLVVRALPPAAVASSRELGADLSRCLLRVST